MISVRLNASDEMSSVMPSALRFFCHQSGSLALSMLASAPTTRNSTSTNESSIGVRCADERNDGVRGHGEADAREHRARQREDDGALEALLEQVGDADPAEQRDDRVGDARWR